MRKFLLPLISLSILAACSKKPVDIPQDIIAKDSMVVILTDVHLAEAVLQLKNLSRNDSTKLVAVGYYQWVFDKNKITPEQFNRSFDFYVRQPELMTTMYDSVITRLSARNLPPV